MEEDANYINRNSRINLSRNTPTAFVVGAATFIGSHLSEKLLEKNIQVIAVDELDENNKTFLERSVKYNRFVFFNESLRHNNDFEESVLNLELPRVDYAFFIPTEKLDDIYSSLKAFLKVCIKERDRLLLDKGLDKKRMTAGETRELNLPKVVFVSSINLYGKDLNPREEKLKSAEGLFARVVKENKLNGRVVRLAATYGPRMSFSQDDPLIRLVHLALLKRLQDENTSLKFSSRALYIDDAVELLLKSIFIGSTAQKIYDGALIQPLKVSEVKQILLDPHWSLSHGFALSELPPWPTPNLRKTMSELSWRAKSSSVKGLEETIEFFKNNESLVPKEAKEFDNQVKSRFMEGMSEETKELLEEEKISYEQKAKSEIKENKKDVPHDSFWKEDKHKRPFFSRKLGAIFIAVLIGYALFFPFVKAGVGAFMIRNNLKMSLSEIEKGDFEEAKRYVGSAEETLDSIEETLAWLEIVKRLGVLSAQLDYVSGLIDIGQEGMLGVRGAVEGTENLYKATKIISGEDSSDPKVVYESAQLDLKSARERLGSVSLKLGGVVEKGDMPGYLESRMIDLRRKLEEYLVVVDRAEAAAVLLPQITAVDGKKSYLVVMQNNMELRPTGGFIGSYAKLDFENGRIRNIKVDDVYNLDGNLKEKVAPPAEIRSDLGQQNWYLRDANFEPDFPTSARQIEFFYNKEAGERVNGVIGMDLSAAAKLLNAVGGVELAEYGERVNGGNLFERVVTHAEVNFFPGSQAKRNYLTALSNELFNRIFFLSEQNWPEIIRAINSSLEEKHLLVYLDDPQLFSYATAQNWGGVMPRGSESESVTKDFLAVNEANMGANKANYYLVRSSKLATSFSKEGQINHSLRIKYVNNSPSDVFPAGKYKNRVRVYVPIGAKLNKAYFGDVDVTTLIVPFNDYDRTGFSVLIEVEPKTEKTLLINYQLEGGLKFNDNLANYRLDVIKQPGTERDPFDWQLTYPINYKLMSASDISTSVSQELNIATNLSVDRSFMATFSR